MTGTHFGRLDWEIVILFLVGSTIAGLWSKRFIRDLEGYLIAGRRVRGYLGVASIIATEMGLVTVMYSAQKGFTGGFAAFHIALAAAVVAFIVGVTGFIVSPLRNTGVMTIPEFYEWRFSRGTRVLGGSAAAWRQLAQRVRRPGHGGARLRGDGGRLPAPARWKTREGIDGVLEDALEPALVRRPRAVCSPLGHHHRSGRPGP